jgi:hypothetical protein
MTPGGVRAILRNRVYVGELRDGDYVNLEAHPPLIDRDTFDAVQDGASRPPKAYAGAALLAGASSAARAADT